MDESFGLRQTILYRRMVLNLLLKDICPKAAAWKSKSKTLFQKQSVISKARFQKTAKFRFEFQNSMKLCTSNASISNFKVPPLDQRNESITKVKKKKIIDPEPNLEFATIVQHRQIIITDSIKLANEANSSEGWRTKNARHQAQKKAVFVAMLPVKYLIEMKTA